ncbi:MAG: alpha/beta fold hydrolase [Deltaproteobacteria bacterium]|nr:alpha/beta fold hydrolase [Deltaproteobacteria bacterium]
MTTRGSRSAGRLGAITALLMGCLPTASPHADCDDDTTPPAMMGDAGMVDPGEGPADAISYRALATHPGCTTDGLSYEPASIAGYQCAAKAYPVSGEDTSKPIVLLIHGNSDTPGVWESFTASGCDTAGATEGVPMLAENLASRGFRVLAIDMRHDQVTDPADDNERYNAAKNMDHGWGVPIAQHFIRSVLEAYPGRKISLVGHSFGVTVIRDALRRLDVNEGYDVWPRIEDVVLLAGGNHGVSSYGLCAANETMRGEVTCEMGNRDAFAPTPFLGQLNGPSGAWETPCADGLTAYGRDVCGGNAVDYTTIVMQDIPDGTQQDLFVSEASSRLAGADNRLIGLNDFDETNYFFCGLLKNHFGPARALAGISVILEKLES